jgi:cell wall-associated NlpC family hydrolase
MAEWAINSYVEADSSDPTLSMLNPVQSLEQAASREGYTDAAVGRDDQLAAQFNQSAQDVARLQDQLLQQQKQQRALISTADARQRDVQHADDQARIALALAQAQLGDLLTQEQQRIVREKQLTAQQAQLAIARSRTKVDPAVSPGRVGGANGGNGGAPVVRGGGGPPVPATGRVIPPPSPGAAGAVAAARSQLGVPYHWGQMSPGNGFDCSGLTAWAWGQAGRSLPHNAAAQYYATTRVDVADIQPGDLLFYGGSIHHVALYIGNGQMIDAPHTGATVRIGAAFRSDLIGVGRP